MNVHQKGFSVVEILVVIVIVGLLGAVGWLVYDRQNSKTKNSDEVVYTSRQKQEVAKTDDVKQSNFFEIEELGVKFELPNKLAGLYYTMGNDNKTAYFSLDELKGTDCAADQISQVALTRYTDADFENDPVVSKGNARKIGNYYYYSLGGQSACSADKAIQATASQLRADIIKLLPSALQTL